MRLRTRSLTAFGALWLAAAPLAHGAEVFVRVLPSLVFDPQTVIVNSGDTVTWTNEGGFHNVRSDSDFFTSGPPSGALWTFSHTFIPGGTRPYYCEAHGAPGGIGMSGVVVVRPSLSIADRAAVEGNGSATGAADFTVALTPVSTDPVTVMFQTIDGTAVAGSDYTAVSGTLLTYAPGTTTQTATVALTGDAASEDNETYTVRLFTPTSATIADADAVGTILDDDAADFFPVAPCRVADTRPSSNPLAANSTRVFEVSSLCGIPPDARAVALNVTTVNEGDFGNLRLFPADAALPAASTINFSAGKARANNAVILLGTGGRIAVRNDMPPGSSATTDVVIDVSGYFKKLPSP